MYKKKVAPDLNPHTAAAIRKESLTPPQPPKKGYPGTGGGVGGSKSKIHWGIIFSAKMMILQGVRHPNPPPVPARKPQCSGATFRRAVFSAKEVPGAQDLSPRAQTHLPFGCSVVGVMWKPKASLNLQKKNFISRYVYGSWSAGCQNRPLVQWICTGLQICKRRFNPLHRATDFFCTF